MLAGVATLEAIGVLERDPEVVRLDVSRETGVEDLQVSLPATRGDVVHAPPLDERGANALVGVIDGGFDVLHQAFLDAAGKTRIVALWDQYDNTGPAPLDDDGNPLYGTLHTAADIDGYIGNGVVPAGLPRDPRGHGTHVASIAAGRAVGAFAGGVAPEARIVAVVPKLDTPAGDPRSIGYSTAHVDALAFIHRVANQHHLPVAVNVSLGMNAGAHDGTSTLEAAFDNFSAGGRLPGRVLVKSAGNSAANDTHARFYIGSQQVVDLQWDSPSNGRRSDVVELWFNSADDLAFVLEAPDGSQSSAIDQATPMGSGAFPSGSNYSIALDRFHRDNGDTRLSVRITRGSVPRIEVGVWKLIVRGTAVISEGIVDAWIERQRGSAHFVSHVEVEGTLSIPVTANSVIAVAALDRAMTGRVTYFSSRGGTRDGRRRPDVGAPGDAIEAAEAGTASGVAVKNGTSMAAPHVTGAIALLLSQQAARGAPLNANQIRAALTQSSIGFNGRWNPDRGWGMLDIETLLTLFA